MNSKQYLNYANTKDTEWSVDENEKLKLAINLYGNLNKERCEHLHLHVLPYKTSNEIQKKYYELLKERESRNNVTSPQMKHSHNNNSNNLYYKTNTSPNIKIYSSINGRKR
ncbi:hypothetical protein DICPUDRAFT_58429 [Dictyostelium purpureum]|uniref:Myb-like domain-containing protein n=1 Tax=Dictyostelium purpureum TaxID=5786 RepID=F1A0W9_DICPU|nr:uncharacterized protein DICPUDRAFT_58429 [Dictyostelium purpureum]EGC30164.1 hypothetical protein DICPUDRAFT_58429 [Dictyostelium purpureum]|eukprot:XP_003293309.1 hypothetical protein DICPUDRAFT_58429 [Dictyostelium purpureum]